MDDSPALEVLVPAALAGTTLAPDDDAGLLRLFDDPPPRPRTGTHVRAVMVGSLDGAATGADGRSGSLSDAADRRLFRALRALADVVVVGAGTVRAEGYDDVQVPAALRPVRAARGRAERVELAVVTRTGDVPGATLDAGALVITSPGAPGLAALRARVGDDRVLVADGPAGDGGGARVDLAAGLRALAARGLVRVHAEGGPTLLRDLLAAGLVDELCLTLAPLLVGDARLHSLTGGPSPAPAPRRGRHAGAAAGEAGAPDRLELVHLLRGGSTLLGRWRVA